MNSGCGILGSVVSGVQPDIITCTAEFMVGVWGFRVKGLSCKVEV